MFCSQGLSFRFSCLFPRRRSLVERGVLGVMGLRMHSSPGDEWQTGKDMFFATRCLTIYTSALYFPALQPLLNNWLLLEDEAAVTGCNTSKRSTKFSWVSECSQKSFYSSSIGQYISIKQINTIVITKRADRINLSRKWLESNWYIVFNLYFYFLCTFGVNLRSILLLYNPTSPPPPIFCSPLPYIQYNCSKFLFCRFSI